MVSKKNSQQWPPPGWKLQIKSTYIGRSYKCYINTKTGEKLYSKLALLRHIKDGSLADQESQSHMTKEDGNQESQSCVKEHTETSPTNKQMHLREANGSHELPPGWTMEWKTRMSGATKGSKYKVFTDPSTGSKFYSEPEVRRYLKSKKGNPGSSRQMKGGRIKHSSNNRSADSSPSPQKLNLKKSLSEMSKPNIQKSLPSGKRKVVIEKTIDEELPSGWIKEMRIRQRGNQVIRRDPFYFDSTSGLVFRSKPEVLRYLETGEISRHAYRRKNVNINDTESPAEKASSTSPSNIAKTRKRSGKHLSADEASPEQSIPTPPEVTVTKEAQSKRSKRSSSKVISASVRETSLEQIALLPEPSKMTPDVVTTKLSSEKVSTEVQSPPDVAGTREAQSKRITRSSSKVGSASLYGTSLKQITSSPESVVTVHEAVPAKPSSEEVSAEAQDADVKKNDVTHRRMEPSASSRHKSDDVILQKCSNGKPQASNKRIKDKIVSHLPSRSSKRLAGVEAEVILHSIPIEHSRLATKRKPGKTKSTNTDPQKMVAPQEEKTQGFDVNVTPITLPTEIELENNDSLILENGNEMVFEEEDEGPPGFSQYSKNQEGPPGFSQYSKNQVAKFTIDQLFEDPSDTLPENKTENSPGEHKILGVEPNTPPVSKIDKPPGNSQAVDEPGTPFCFPSPLWSDPCLEFAFKTLTGALPLDDNVAIQDYIQHQLRTSEHSNNNRGPDITMPSFCQNDESKLPEDNFTKSNGFSSHKSSR